MAESLNIKITATDSSAAAFASLNRNMSNVSGSFQRLSSTISGFTRGAVGAVLAGSIGEAIGSVVRYADTWTLMQNRLRSAGLTATETANAQTKIADIASRSRSDLAETANLYARVAFATENMGVQQSDVAKVTETLSKAFKMSGKTALEAQSAVTQFTQALSSGVLQGDELRSLRENAPEVARAIANAFGVSVGGLKQLGAEGALTSDKIFKAILDAAPQIEARFATTQSTFSDLFTRMTNAVQLTIGRIQDMLAQDPVIRSALEAQIQAEKKLEDQINSTSEAQIRLNNEQQSNAATDAAIKYNELTKRIWETKDAANAAFEEFKQRSGFLSEALSIDPSKFDEALSLLQKMINSTGSEALQASIKLRELEASDPNFAKAIASVASFSRELIGLTKIAEQTKQKLDELSVAKEFQIKVPELPQPKGLILQPQGTSALDVGPAELTRQYIENQRVIINQTNIQADAQRRLNEAKRLGIPLSEEQALKLAQEADAHDRNAKGAKDYNKELEDLIQKYRESADPLLKYREDLAFIEEAYSKGRISADVYAESVANIKTAMEKAAENADPLKKQTEELTRAFEGFGRKASDAIADFVVEGKGNFSDLIKSMIKDLISFMIYQNLMKPLFSGLSSGFNFSSLFQSSSVPLPPIVTRATGGSVSSGSSYLVGEHGPELFMPNRSGSIAPNGFGGGGGNVSVNIINNSNAQATATETMDGRGNRKIDVVIGEVVAKEIGRIGSSVNQSIRNTFQTSPALVGR